MVYKNWEGDTNSLAKTMELFKENEGTCVVTDRSFSASCFSSFIVTLAWKRTDALYGVASSGQRKLFIKGILGEGPKATLAPSL